LSPDKDGRGEIAMWCPVNGGASWPLLFRFFKVLSMKFLPMNCGDGVILDAVREWIDLLVKERYEDAYRFLYHPPGAIWSSDIFREVVEEIGGIRPDYEHDLFRYRKLDHIPKDSVINLVSSSPITWFLEGRRLIDFNLPNWKQAPQSALLVLHSEEGVNLLWLYQFRKEWTYLKEENR
jgi:hypothetical protein